MPTLTFKTTVLQAGDTATGIEAPQGIVDHLKAGKRPPFRHRNNRSMTSRLPAPHQLIANRPHIGALTLRLQN